MANLFWTEPSPIILRGAMKALPDDHNPIIIATNLEEALKYATKADYLSRCDFAIFNAHLRLGDPTTNEGRKLLQTINKTSRAIITISYADILRDIGANHTLVTGKDFNSDLLKILNSKS